MSDMLDLKLTADGDLDVTGLGIQLIGGAPRVAQQVRTALRVFLEEWDFDLDEGVPWYQRILGKKDVKLNDVENLLRDKILSVEDVRSLKAFSLKFDSSLRKLTVSARLDTVFGPETVEGDFP